MTTVLLSIMVLAMPLTLRASSNPGGLAAWSENVSIHRVLPHAEYHSMHSYYCTSPESPDGKYLLLYTSETADGQTGDIRVIDRSRNTEQILVGNINAEDAHRVAAQQWISNGQGVVFQDFRNESWLVATIDLKSKKEKILAVDRMCGFGPPQADWVPVYGLPWRPEKSSDLELINAKTGERKTSVTAVQVRKDNAAALVKTFGDAEVSIFFPMLSADLKRVFFKMAAPKPNQTGEKRHGKSNRQGLFCYDLEQPRQLFSTQAWGHPAWMPDNQTILDIGTLSDLRTGQKQALPNWPCPGNGCHPSPSPDGRFIVFDTPMEILGGAKEEWGIGVYEIQTGKYVIIYRFDNSKGAISWRRSHPHPVFSADGRRIYFNVSSDHWTRLYVAEAGGMNPHDEK